MDIKETLLDNFADLRVHPIGGRIYLLPPDICQLLYNGNDINFFVSERRDLVPLVIGIMAMNLVAAKSLGQSYPNTLIDPVLWRPEYIDICKKLVFRTENGIEASLRTLEPSNFIYLRVSNCTSQSPTIRVLFKQAKEETTRLGMIHTDTN